MFDLCFSVTIPRQATKTGKIRWLWSSDAKDAAVWTLFMQPTLQYETRGRVLGRSSNKRDEIPKNKISIKYHKLYIPSDLT
jgi:hypothetical protein